MSETELKRITINLNPRTVQDMADLMRLMGATQTEVVNMSVKFFAYWKKFLDDGGAFYAKDALDGEMERVRII